MKNEIYQRILEIPKSNGAGFILLLDPDKLPFNKIEETIGTAIENSVDVIFVGGTFLLQKKFNEFVKRVKNTVKDIPVIIFPGSVYQISEFADALLYLSLISGRNPSHLIESQVIAAPIIWQMEIEPISCAYMLVDSGKLTSVSFMSNSTPLPRNKPDIALAHALAAQYLGFKTLYLEAGSGAEISVPENMITVIKQAVDIPMIVGGGIRTPADAAKKVEAGASFVVIGNFFEEENNQEKIKEFAAAIHGR